MLDQIKIVIEDGYIPKNIDADELYDTVTKLYNGELFLSEFMVDTHRKNIFKKLNIHSIQELIRFIYELLD